VWRMVGRAASPGIRDSWFRLHTCILWMVHFEGKSDPWDPGGRRRRRPKRRRSGAGAAPAGGTWPRSGAAAQVEGRARGWRSSEIRDPPSLQSPHTPGKPGPPSKVHPSPTFMPRSWVMLVYMIRLGAAIMTFIPGRSGTGTCEALAAGGGRPGAITHSPVPSQNSRAAINNRQQRWFTHAHATARLAAIRPPNLPPFPYFCICSRFFCICSRFIITNLIILFQVFPTKQIICSRFSQQNK